jgi:mannose-1-phosphate guanylyltransferase
MKVVILADDVGNKLWPVTTPKTPKALVPVFGDKTMLDLTLDRAVTGTSCAGSDIFITLPSDALDLLYLQPTLDNYDIPLINIFAIPAHRGTAVSMYVILNYMQQVHAVPEGETILFIPVDQFFWPSEGFVFHLCNMLEGFKEDPEKVMMMVMDPPAPFHAFNYVKVDWETAKAIGNVYNDDESNTISTLATPALGYKAAVPIELSDGLIADNWLLDLYTYIGKLSTFNTYLRAGLDKSFLALADKYFEGAYWEGEIVDLEVQSENSLGSAGDLKNGETLLKKWKSIKKQGFESEILPGIISKKKCTTCVISKVVWSMLDSWLSLKYLMYDAGLFHGIPIAGVHLVDSDNNLIFKPPGKDVALYGVSDLIIIDSGEKLLIGTAGALNENF